MRRFHDAWPLAVPALAALLLTAAPIAASEHEAGEQKKVKIQKYVIEECEGDDCGEVKEQRRVIVVGDGDAVHGIEGDAMHWVDRQGVHAFAMPHHGKGGFLGVATTELTPELRSHFGVPEEAGVLVAKVVDDSAAARAGVQVGDILTAVGGEAVASTGHLIRAVGVLEPGAAVDLELWRDGSLQTLGATLGERRPARRHVMVRHCGDGEDCPRMAALGELDCGDDSDCEVKIECRDGGCECTVNGESAECETLPGFAAPGE